MHIYIKLFEVIFPVFFVVGIGYYLGKKNPKIDTSFITNFGANIGSPAIVFYSVTTTGLSLEVFGTYFINVFITFFICILLRFFDKITFICIYVYFIIITKSYPETFILHEP